MLPDLAISRKMWGRLAAALIGLLLLAHLVRRAGPSRLLEGIASVGWGLVLVIALAGLSQAVRTWAWRLTLLDAGRRPSFGRMFALRLASEAAGQVGVFGQVFGDTWRVARLGADLPHCDTNYFSSAGSCPVHAEQHHRDHRGCSFAGLRVTSPRQDRSLREGIRFRPRGYCVPGGDCRATALASDLRPGGSIGATSGESGIGWKASVRRFSP